MFCPHCSEEVTLFALLKHWFWMKIPHPIFIWNERRNAECDLNKLKMYYSTTSHLTDREHHVCSRRVNGDSVQQIADQMGVTYERVRQIQAKALRKLIKGDDNNEQ